jgi:hypothetical protein
MWKSRALGSRLISDSIPRAIAFQVSLRQWEYDAAMPIRILILHSSHQKRALRRSGATLTGKKIGFGNTMA